MTNMKRLFTLIVLIAVCTVTASAQRRELSIKEAIALMKQTPVEYLSEIFQKADSTGVDQFVDVEINEVHDFSDFSFGAMLEEFEQYLTTLVPVVKLSDGSIVSVRGADEQKAKNARMLEFAKANQKMIACYMAEVDYDGITKYEERKSLSRTFFFSDQGEIITVKKPGCARAKYKSKVAPAMEKKIVELLKEANDPLFLPCDYWISDEVSAPAKKGNPYILQWGYLLTKRNLDEQGVDRGTFTCYVYQTKVGLLVLKALAAIDGEYEMTNDHISFNYGKAEVSSFSPRSNTSGAVPGKFVDIDFREWTPLLFEAGKIKKTVNEMSDTPETFNRDGDTIEMSVPFYDAPVVLKLRRDLAESK